jgi:hypothetical protein
VCIERLWHDVRKEALEIYQKLFAYLESKGLLDMENPIHRVCLFIVYSPMIQASLDRTVASWNLHKLRTAHNRSPLAIYELSREQAIQQGYWTGDPGDDIRTASAAEYGLDSDGPRPATNEDEADGASAEPDGDAADLRAAGVQLNAEEELKAAEDMFADAGIDVEGNGDDDGISAFCRAVAFMEACFGSSTQD